MQDVEVVIRLLEMAEADSDLPNQRMSILDTPSGIRLSNGYGEVYEVRVHRVVEASV